MVSGDLRRVALVALLSMLAACGRIIPPANLPPPLPPRPSTSQPAILPVVPPVAITAAALGLRPGADIASLALSPDGAASALVSFRQSCPELQRRVDGSGLTRQGDWQSTCAAAAAWTGSDARSFFLQNFESAQVGDGTSYVTGYYEPEIAGVRTRQPGFDVPVYALPPDLIRAWPAETPIEQQSGRPPLGRYDQTGKFVPYYQRSEIDDGALVNTVPVIAWAADPVEFFFLQIQGSGRLRAPDGSVMRIGYAGQNGRDYVGLGSLMRQRGLIGTEPGQYAGSMQGIMQFLRDRPDEGKPMMRENMSWVFFRELTGEGPVGALGYPVRAKLSLAADPSFVPLGAPVWLSVDRGEVTGLWITQDTGGAIKGANRFDSFWGAGAEARLTAGGMAARGQALVFLPKGTLTRLGVPQVGIR